MTTYSSPGSGGHAGLNGIQKYWVWTGGWWEPEHDGDLADDGYHACLFLHPGATHYGFLSCDGQHTQCPENPGDTPCRDYMLDLVFPQCGATENIHEPGYGVCPDDCACDPFRLRFNGIPMNGGPQGPFSGGVYTYACGSNGCDIWPVSSTEDPSTFIYLMDVEFTREYSCCCPNLDKPTAPDLAATIESPPGQGPCLGTMEGATVTLTKSGEGKDCKTYEGELTFTCADGDEHTLTFSMACVGDITDGFCCTDYHGTISWTGGGGNEACCDDADNNQTTHAAAGCVCHPPHFRFGPFRLWHDGVNEDPDCCRCSEVFNVVVTEAPG